MAPCPSLPAPSPVTWALGAYGIVLDAGSSHTSMFIYKWPADKKNDTGIVSQHSSCNVHGGGISSYADNPSGAGQSLVECLDQALRDVPKDRHRGTPLYLGATAGMRLLNLTRPEAATNVLAAVTRTLTQYPFHFRGARILSGQDEGVFGWVTANYLLEKFIKYGWVGQWFQPRKGTLGAMDLGGASTQITFETASPAEDPANEVQLRLYGQHYRVYTHSFLCYGRDQVLQRLLAGALQTHGPHPCWPRGYSAQVQLQDVYDSPCTAAQGPLTFNSSASISLSGSSEPALCRSLVSQLFNFSSCHFSPLSSCHFSQCSFNGVFQPPVTGSFIAFSAFFYTMDFLRTVMGLPVATLQQLEAAATTLCSQTWSELQARAPGERAHLPNYCAGATFMQQLLSRGYGFDEGAFSGATVVFVQYVAACPGSLDCALKRRARCPPGAHICGPCLQPFQEDHQGLCVPRMRRPPAEGPPQPRLEDEIDFLARELARQEAGPSRLTAPPQLGARQRLLEPAATLGLSERGQGPDLGLPSTRGAPAPTPHTSLGTPVSSGPVHMAPLEPRGSRSPGSGFLAPDAWTAVHGSEEWVSVLRAEQKGMNQTPVRSTGSWRSPRDILELLLDEDGAAPQPGWAGKA
nr:PREDICTED: LOW QUALITY PROTEIN: ectonucleoside triphosphate diphosphohydrolase 2-like [Equus przewalskii]